MFVPRDSRCMKNPDELKGNLKQRRTGLTLANGKGQDNVDDNDNDNYVKKFTFNGSSTHLEIIIQKRTTNLTVASEKNYGIAVQNERC